MKRVIKLVCTVLLLLMTLTTISGCASNLEEIRKQAEQGDAESQAALGHIYSEGKGVSKDYVEAEKWYRKSAEQGHRNGQKGLGDIYSEGKGVSKDYVEAVKWYRKASEQGHEGAPLMLYVMYSKGEGVKKDVVQSYMWLYLAVENGTMPPALMDAMEKKMTPEQITKAQRLYSEWKKKHPQKMKDDGNVTAEPGITADGQVNNKTKMEEWHRLAEQGDTEKQIILAKMYYHGKILPQDYLEAAKWCRKAAEQGMPEAQTFLGKMFFTGEGVSKDWVEARKWFRKAAEQGDGLAQGLLGGIYAGGFGVPKDFIQAHLWYTLAAENGQKRNIKSQRRVEKFMAPEQIAEAQRLASEWKKKHPPK